MSAPQPFQARLGDDGVVWLSGELDMSTADSFSQALASQPGRWRPVLDLTELTFLDSSGIRAILRLARTCQQAVVLRNTAPNVRRVLDVAGVDESMGVRIEPQPDR
jgi:anti-anti-sigma factor